MKTVMECVKWILNGFAPFTKGMFLKARLFIYFFVEEEGNVLYMLTGI